MKKYIFADMDGTLSESKTPVSNEMREFLQDKTLIAVSGANEKQMRYQLEGIDCEIMAQCGNSCSLWEHVIDEESAADAYTHIDKLRAHFQHDESDGLVYVDHRGCQINYSVIGSNNLLEIKKAFDPDFSNRIKVLDAIPFKSDVLEIRIAGTTGYDYTLKGKNKGSNVADYIKHHGWNPAECIYFGDALFPGGNDETVVGIIDTVAVTSPEDTLAKLKELFPNNQ